MQASLPSGVGNRGLCLLVDFFSFDTVSCIGLLRDNQGSWSVGVAIVKFPSYHLQVDLASKSEWWS
jgi:hypothetical protein